MPMQQLELHLPKLNCNRGKIVLGESATVSERESRRHVV